MSNIYSFFINCKRKITCKTMYLNTLSISEQFVKTPQLKLGRSGLVLMTREESIFHVTNVI